MGEPTIGTDRYIPPARKPEASGPMAHPILDSRDFAYVHHRMEGVFSPFELALLGEQAGFHARASTAALGKLRLVDLTIGSELAARPEPLVDYYSINIVLDGAMNVRRDHESATVGRGTVGTVLTPDSAIEMRFSADCRWLCVLVGRRELDNAFHAMWADLPRSEDFAIGLDQRQSQVASWVQLVRWAAADLARSESLAAHPVLAGQIEDLIVNGFLAAGSRRLSPAYPREQPMIPAAVRRARDYIESRATEPLTVADAARVAGVSVRALQQGFRQHYGVTPIGYLREVRLDHVHRELQSAQPRDGVTVTETALRWGFGHLPRFAATYQQRFGRLPSETLRHAEQG